MKQNNIIIPVDHPLKNTLDALLPPPVKFSLETQDLPHREWYISINYAAYNRPAYALCCLNGTPVRATFLFDIYHAVGNLSCVFINTTAPYIKHIKNKHAKEATLAIIELINS